MIARDTVKAWYFAPVSRRLRHGDDRKIVVGETHSVSGPISLCENGLHASEFILDALWYAPGPIVYRVELSGDMLFDDDKIAARHRKYLWGGGCYRCAVAVCAETGFGMRRPVAALLFQCPVRRN